MKTTDIIKNLSKMSKSELRMICREMNCNTGSKKEMLTRLVAPLLKGKPKFKMGKNLLLRRNSPKYKMDSSDEDSDYLTSETDIFDACSELNVKQVDLLLDAGADVNQANYNGDTPLIAVIEYTPVTSILNDMEMREIVELLLDAGADVNKADRNGNTPLAAAIRGYNDEEIVELLLDAGADVNKANKYGNTPLSSAIRSYDGAVVELLLDAGADVNQVNKYGRTPLYNTSREGYIWGVKLLLEAGADVNQADNSGFTPLIAASHWGRVSVVKLLLAAPGIDVNKAAEDGLTALEASIRRNHFEVKRLIEGWLERHENERIEIRRLPLPLEVIRDVIFPMTGHYHQYVKM